MVLHPLHDSGLLLCGADHEVVALALADEHAIVFLSPVFVEHGRVDDGADRYVDITRAQGLEVVDQALGLTRNGDLGVAGKVEDADSLTANVVFFLDAVEESRLSKRTSREGGWRVLPGVEGDKVEGSLPAHLFSENGPAGLQLAKEGRGSDLATFGELIDQRILQLIVSTHDFGCSFQEKPKG